MKWFWLLLCVGLLLLGFGIDDYQKYLAGAKTSGFKALFWLAVTSLWGAGLLLYGIKAKDKTGKDEVLGFIFWGLFVFEFGGGAYLYFSETEVVCVDRRLITSVGGCDLLGDCGVVFSDGTQGTWKKPTRGQSVCLQEKRIDKPK